MRVWLAGSRTFGAAVFKALRAIDGVYVAAVTAPWKDGDRDALWRTAMDTSGCSVHAAITADQVRDRRADVIVSAQNYAFIDADARAAARHGAIGYHPSLLPRHRGRNSVEWTVAMGDPIAGGTVFQMDDGWDTGPIILQDWCHVRSHWTASDLWRERLFPMGVQLLRQALTTLQDRGFWYAGKQDEADATYEPEWDENSWRVAQAAKVG